MIKSLKHEQLLNYEINNLILNDASSRKVILSLLCPLILSLKYSLWYMYICVTFDFYHFCLQSCHYLFNCIDGVSHFYWYIFLSSPYPTHPQLQLAVISTYLFICSFVIIAFSVLTLFCHAFILLLTVPLTNITLYVPYWVSLLVVLNGWNLIFFFIYLLQDDLLLISTSYLMFVSSYPILVFASHISLSELSICLLLLNCGCNFIYIFII